MSDDPSRDVAIFTEALHLPAEAQGAFLNRACAGDEDLRRKVAALLDAYERAGDFLETPPPETRSPSRTDMGNGEAQDKPDGTDDDPSVT